VVADFRPAVQLPDDEWMRRMITLMLTTLFAFSPAPAPDPDLPYGSGVNLTPSYTVQGDGTRLQCSPTANTCWRDTTGLPSYLQGS